MLCSKCHESIPRGKEIQIEGTIFCKECDLVVKKEDKKKVVARCWNCNKFIYKDELVHGFTRNDSKNFSKWFSIGSGSSEKLFQCDECYQKWRNNVKKAKNLSWVRVLLVGICTGLLLSLIMDLFFPEKFKKLDNISVIIFLILLLTIIFALGPALDVDRYKTSASKKKARSKNIVSHA